MKLALEALNRDLLQRYPNYVCRVTPEDGKVAQLHLNRCREPKSDTPAVLTMSSLPVIGMDIPTTHKDGV
jgi:type I restriction enzyme R subunit